MLFCCTRFLAQTPTLRPMEFAQNPPPPLKNSRHSRRFVGNLRKQWNLGLRNAGADSKPTLRGTLNALKRNGLSPFAG
jgi:hypothetical protein